jgi:hypothetical protein
MGVQAEQCHCLQLGCALQKRGLGSRNGPFGNKLAALCNARLGNIVRSLVQESNRIRPSALIPWFSVWCRCLSLVARDREGCNSRMHVRVEWGALADMIFSNHLDFFSSTSNPISMCNKSSPKEN